MGTPRKLSQSKFSFSISYSLIFLIFYPMSAIDDELLNEAEEDAREIEFIRNYLPLELKEKFSDDELYYFLDVIIDYYMSSDILNKEPDKDG